MKLMRAAQYDRYGPPSVLYVADIPIPQVRPGQVLVRVHASTVNGGELAGRAGKLRLFLGRRFPQKVGIDLVGDVARVGADVTTVDVGDHVWGIVDETFGAAAEYVTISPAQIASAPANLDAAEAATLLAGGTTAITALRDKARLSPGERLLVRGASGGVGSLAVQIGKLFGAHVTGLASARNADFVHQLGADEVYDYRAVSPTELGEFDVVLDTVGTDHPAFRRLLASGGRMVAVSFDVGRIISSFGYLVGSAVHGSRRVRFFRGKPKSDLFAELTRYAERGDVRPVVDTVHSLENIAEAHRVLEAGGVRGKHVVSID